MAHGGKRDGSGRPEGSVEQQTLYKREMRRRLVELAHERMEDIFQAQLDLALGHWKESEVTDPLTGVTSKRVYKKSPNGEALAYLMDQTLDKAIQRSEVDHNIRHDKPLSKDEEKLLDQSLAFAAQPQAEAVIPLDEPAGTDGESHQDASDISEADG